MKNESQYCFNKIAEMMRESDPVECLEFKLRVTLNEIDLDSIQNEDELASYIFMYAGDLVGDIEDDH